MGLAKRLKLLSFHIGCTGACANQQTKKTPVAGGYQPGLRARNRALVFLAERSSHIRGGGEYSN